MRHTHRRKVHIRCRPRRFLAWLVVPASLGCSLILDAGREQCVRTEDCVARGAGFTNTICVDSLCEDAPTPPAEGPWRCLIEPVEPPLPTAPTAHVRLQVCDLVRGCAFPIAGLTAKVCSKVDVGCGSPLPANVSYANGVFDFDVLTGTTGFDGYIEISTPPELCTNREVFGDASALVCSLLPQCDVASPDARCSISPYAPVLRFFNPPIVADAELTPLSITSLAAQLGLMQTGGAAPDPTTGILVVTAVDCDGMGAAGVTLSIGDQSGMGQVAYLANGVPSSALTETDGTGIAVFTGVPAGFVNVVARDGTGMRVGSVGVYVAASSGSIITLVPSP